LKVIRREALGDSQAIERFLFEARTTAQLSHPHVVTIYGVGEHEGRPYLALEFLEGQTLRERLDESPPGAPEGLRFGLAIAEAIRESHRHEILHRGLKPENVVIPSDGRLRVLDFGLATVTRHEEVVPSAAVPSRLLDLALAQTMVRRKSASEQPPNLAATQPPGLVSDGQGLRGTPLYMAPEQWSEKPRTVAAAKRSGAATRCKMRSASFSVPRRRCLGG